MATNWTASKAAITSTIIPEPASVLIVAGSLIWRAATGTPVDAGLTVARPQSVTVRVIVALPVEPWVRAAAEHFNASNKQVEGSQVHVEIIAMDGLTALGRWDRNDFGALPAGVTPDQISESERAGLANFPTAWIPDSRYLVELAAQNSLCFGVYRGAEQVGYCRNEGYLRANEMVG